MKRALAFAFVLATTLSLGLSLAHAEDPETRGKDGDTLTPMAIGNTWVYESKDDDYISTDRVDGVVSFDGQPWYLLRSYEREKGKPEADNEPIGFELWITMLDGHECDATIVAEESLGLENINQYFRFPATAGETYKPNADDPTLRVTVIAVSEKVKTKAGEFDCIVYKETVTDDETYVHFSYVAPGVGVVKYVTTDVDGTYTAELISYTLVEDE